MVIDIATNGLVMANILMELSPSERVAPFIIQVRDDQPLTGTIRETVLTVLPFGNLTKELPSLQ